MSEFTSIAQALKEAGKRLRELEAEEDRTLDIGFCPICNQERIIIWNRCAHCQQLLVGSATIPIDALPGVAPWSAGDPGAPVETVVAVDGDTVTVEIGEFVRGLQDAEVAE